MINLSAMSNALTTAINKTRLSLFVFSLLLAVCSYYLWQYWPTVLIASIQAQKYLYTQFTELLQAAKEHDLLAGIMLVGMSFLYGLLHSLGPGHGKVIMSTYVATHTTKVKLSLILTLVSALLQALVAIVLVSVLLMVFSASMKVVNHTAAQMIELSFYAVVILGGIIVWRNVLAIRQSFKAKASIATPTTTSTCSCGHSHSADAAQVNRASSLREYIGVILSIGLRPCSGAIMVLLFSSVLDIYWLGIISAIAMGLGTALTTSLIALMTISGKKLLSFYSQSHTHGKYNSQNSKLLSDLYSKLLALFGGLLLVAIGLILLASEPVAMTTLFTR